MLLQADEAYCYLGLTGVWYNNKEQSAVDKELVKVHEFRFDWLRQYLVNIVLLTLVLPVLSQQHTDREWNQCQIVEVCCQLQSLWNEQSWLCLQIKDILGA